MPSKRYFDQCPAFPSDIPIADLLTVSLGQLENQSQSETLKLFDACCRDGFFMLDLSGSTQGRILIQDAECIFDLAIDTMHLDQAELKQYTYKPPQDLLGYKAAGNLKTDDGGMDTTDMYSLGQDDILGTIFPRRKNPPPIEAQRPACGAFFQHAHAAIAIILNALDRQLALPEGTLQSRCSLSKPSATSLRLLRTASPQQQPVTSRVTFGAHGDIGLITLLFHVAGGLQLLPPDSDDLVHGWRFVQPRPGRALVNIGDTLAAWTGGVLRSALHRVVTAPGHQSAVPRISLAYLVRPAHGESMRRLRGDGIPVLVEGEEAEDFRTVDEWADERSARFGDGKVHRQRARARSPVIV